MSNATPQQIALADRICREQQPRMAFDAALSAIIETQRLDASLAASHDGNYDRGPYGSPFSRGRNKAAKDIAEGIRKGAHYV